MIKGCQRKMIMLQGGECAPFESAYFVLKKNVDASGDPDMIREATRIIERSLPDRAARLRRREAILRRLCFWLIFSSGVLVGSAVTLLPLLLFGIY